MSYIADFHIHSKYSRATAKDMDIAGLVKWAKLKGIAMLGTGDFTHPQWMAELESSLGETGRGVYGRDGVSFVLTAEVSNIYRAADRTRRVHNMIFAPGFSAAKEAGRALSEFGNLSSDGRPVLKLPCDRMVKILSGIDPEIFVVPSHAWTPHFSVFGSKSGFDSLEECFGEETPKIFAIETGLSSDPAMNWRWSKLDRICLISNSDAHSPSKIGREANVFRDEIDYRKLVDVLKRKDRSSFLYTIEFFPEEGKYHWDGHRACRSPLAPAEAIRLRDLCPVCGRKVTIGVARRVEKLADRPDGYIAETGPSYKRVVPLAEIIADSMGVSAVSVRVEREYLRLVAKVGTEMRILLELGEDEIRAACPAGIAEGIIDMRRGNVEISPGYDGEYGTVRVCRAKHN